jgi:alanine racemase
MTKPEPLRPVWAEIDLGNFKKNLQVVQGLIPASTQIIAVVKANAYGIGAVPASRAALEVPGVMGLAVATPEEAIELRSESIDCGILVLGPVTPGGARALADLSVSMAVTSTMGIQSAEEAGKSIGRKTKIHIKVETGMGRTGFMPGPELQKALDLLQQCNYVEVEGIFTHFSAADVNKKYTMNQWSNFNTAVEQASQAHIRPRYLHAANSAAILDFPESHLDLVRPGIMIYGSYPDQSLAGKAPLYPVFSLKARVSYVKHVGPGSYIGYGMTYRTGSGTTIATVPIGYADGYPRLLSNRGSVLIKGRRYPIAGRICMDQLMIDLGGTTDVEPGELVTLIGQDGTECITVDEVAELAQTIAHEILTGIAPRVPRIYM